MTLVQKALVNQVSNTQRRNNNNGMIENTLLYKKTNNGMPQNKDFSSDAPNDRSMRTAGLTNRTMKRQLPVIPAVLSMT